MSVLEAKKPFLVEEATTPDQRPLYALHLTDLHLWGDADPIGLLQPLMADLRDPLAGLGLQKLDYLIVSGDFGNRASPQEFEQARLLISEIIKQFQLTAERCILVPGNHDVDWTVSTYTWAGRRQQDTAKLGAGTYVEQDRVLGVRDDANYPSRFKSFSENFFHPLMQKEYPLKYENQCMPYLFPDTGIQFITMNSCWEIDEFYPERSSIHTGALSRGLQEADDQISNAKCAGQIQEGKPILRIAVWHHPVTGNEKIADDAFLDRIRQADVRLCLHGHVHELRTDLIGYIHPTRQLHVAGAGTFGAEASQRPESTPQLVNILEIQRDLSRIRIHTRSRRKTGGVWEGWAMWLGSTGSERRTYYDIELK